MQLNPSNGEVLKSKPRCLPSNTTAVVELTFDRPVCLETMQASKALGRVTLRHNGATVGAGIVLAVKDKL